MTFLELLNSGAERGGRINGVVVGIVTNNKDPEGMGRVKLKFPWREVEDESYWARIATLMAGKEMGAFFLPEVGDEVLVAFDQGDIHHPYVLGGLWNGKDKPPETNSDGKNNIRKIKSRSGHEIIFNDNDAEKKEHIEIHTNAGHSILLDDSGGEEKIEIKDMSGKNIISVDTKENKITITSEKDIELSATNGKVIINAKELEIKASSAAKIESSADLTLKASGNTNIKGATVNIN